MKRAARRGLGLALAALVWGCGGGGGSSTETGQVAGYVFVRSGQLVLLPENQPAAGDQPADGALCTILNGGFASTQADGHFQIANVFAGRQTLRVDLAGFLPVQVSVLVKAGQTTLVGLDPGTGATRKWTVMVYLNADNEGEAAGIAAVNEMEQVGSSDEVAVVVLMDRSPGFDTSNGDWTTARRFLVGKDTDATEMTSARTPSEGGEAADLGELDLGDPATLAGFIAGAQQQYAAEHYLLVIGGRGTGWRGRAAAGRGVSFDESSDNGAGTHLGTIDLASGLAASTKVEVVAFDAGLMQMLEVAYQIRSRCEVVVGSQETPPAGGYPYAALLQGLESNPTLTATALGRHIVTTMVDAYRGSQAVTQSALATSGLGAVATALDLFAQQLRAISDTDHDAIMTAWQQVQAYGGGDARFAGYRDLVDLADKLGTGTGDGTLILRANDLIAKVGAAVLSEGHDGGSVADSHGMSIYMPTRADYQDPGVGGENPTKESYRDLQLSLDTAWENWLGDFALSQPKP